MPRLPSTVLQSRYQNYHAARKPWGTVSSGPARAALFRAWIGRGLHVLDLGCRDGTLTRAYVVGNRLVGADIDGNALKICRSALDIPVCCMDMNAGLPFGSGTFDVVVMGEVLEHGFFPDQMLSEARRVLRPGGRVVGSVPNVYRLKNRLGFLAGRELQYDAMHLHLFSIRRLERLLGRYFDAVAVVPVSSRFLPLSPALFANTLAWRGVKGGSG